MTAQQGFPVLTPEQWAKIDEVSLTIWDSIKRTYESFDAEFSPPAEPTIITAPKLARE